jgi:hypothetical protein
MIAKQAAFRMQGIDTDTSLLENSAIVALGGAKFVVRYAGDVTLSEAEAIFGEGLLLSLVQHPRTGVVSGPLGSADGLSVVTQAHALGFPEGATVWCDLESWVGSVSDACAYVNEWSTCVVAGGYEAGLYVGYATSPLPSQALAALASTAYWKGCSAYINEPAGVGFQMYQLVPGDQSLGGILVDWNVVQRDFKGRLPTFAAGS